MTERKLKEYFENTLPVEQLALDLKDSQKKTSHDVTSVYVDTINEDGEFKVTKEHLIKLSNDVLSGHLLPIDLNTIAFAIIGSDFFCFDDNPGDEEIINTVIYDWDNPDIGFDLSLKNIELWKEYLQTGEYNLDGEELKKKFR